jgi:hypothetical protein
VTVRRYISELVRKLGVDGRAQLLTPDGRADRSTEHNADWVEDDGPVEELASPNDVDSAAGCAV